MTIEQREAIRTKCLIEEYERYFHKGGGKAKIQNDEESEEVREKFLAIKYLGDKEFLELISENDISMTFRITAKGIDHVETILKEHEKGQNEIGSPQNKPTMKDIKL